MYENDHLQLSYSQSSFPKLLVTKPKMVAHTPGGKRWVGEEEKNAREGREGRSYIPGESRRMWGSDRPGLTSSYDLQADVFGRTVNLSEPRFWHSSNRIIMPTCTVH